MKKPALLDLRPCQFVLGMKEVESKIKKMGQLNEKELRAYCDDHVIPLVRGPEHELYIIDHHHFARACWELKVESYSVHVIEDLTHLSDKDFWHKMIKNKWTYLQDQFGFGPHLPSALPADIRCLADDPFRSLVWTAIDAGAIKKQAIPFFEFQWAAFFRLSLDLRLHSKSNFKSAIKQAIELAQSKASDQLPGYLGPAKKQKSEKKAEKASQKNLKKKSEEKKRKKKSHK